MVTDKIIQNATSLELEINWFTQVLNTRMQLYFSEPADVESIYEITPPEIDSEQSVLGNFLSHYETNFAERIVLLLSLIPYIKPELLDVFFHRNDKYDRGYTEFGGLKGSTHGGFLPTGETAMFLLAENMEMRFALQSLFQPDHYFAKHSILHLEQVDQREPFLSGALKVSQEFIDYFTTGEVRKSNFNSNFPARLITTELDWEDLVLDTKTLKHVDEIKAWIDFGHVLLNDWELSKKIRPGYRSLFYGPPGTGKTMTACLLGKATNRDVYRIDLSMVVSKYIGETEKNLSKIFEQAEHKNWILFFDEADSLFGKRTAVEDAHDKYANQEVSFLLQRIEVFNGIIILASNMKGNLDEAFTRRFESIINFPIPDYDQRLLLWKQGFSPSSDLEERVNLRQIAKEHPITGGTIMNVIRYASMMTLKRQSNIILNEEIEEGIKKEYMKEGKTL